MHVLVEGRCRAVVRDERDIEISMRERLKNAADN
jgi:hypothetical protein